MLPNFFSKAKIPKKLPKDTQEVVDKLKKSKNKKDCLKKAYAFIPKKFVGCHFYVRFFDIFTANIDKLWSRKNSHCTNLNYLLRVLLIKSGFFKESDIGFKWTLVWYISVHQYLKVKLSDKTIYVDPWGSTHGIKLGDYAHGFNV